MKPGDLVTLKHATWYHGVDTNTGHAFIVPEGSLGIFIRTIVADEDWNHTRAGEVIFTCERMVGCDFDIWKLCNEAR